MTEPPPITNANEASGTIGCGVLFMLAPIPGYFMAEHVNKLNPQKPPSYFQLWVGIAIGLFGLVYVILSVRGWLGRAIALKIDPVMLDAKITYGEHMQCQVTFETMRDVTLSKVTAVLVRSTERDGPKTMERGYGPHGYEQYRTPPQTIATKLALTAGSPHTLDFEVFVPAEQGIVRQEWENDLDSLEAMGTDTSEHLERWVLLVFAYPSFLPMTFGEARVQETLAAHRAQIIESAPSRPPAPESPTW